LESVYDHPFFFTKLRSNHPPAPSSGTSKSPNLLLEITRSDTIQTAISPPSWVITVGVLISTSISSA
jgi:hypothetical protein